MPYGLRVIRTRSQLGSVQAASELWELSSCWWCVQQRGVHQEGVPIKEVRSAASNRWYAGSEEFLCHAAGLSPLMLLANANRSCDGETSGQVSSFQDGGLSTKMWNNSAVHATR